jgi:hypothetical protein
MISAMDWQKDIEQRIWELSQMLKHLPGEHDQDSHGGEGGGVSEAFTLSSAAKQTIDKARDRLRSELPTICLEVSMAIEKELGFKWQEGVYTGPGRNRDWEVAASDYYDNAGEDDEIYSHSWNVTSDGTILDATADQFEGEDNPIRVIPPDDPRQEWYTTDPFPE